jgi:hypothetical protein
VWKSTLGSIVAVLVSLPCFAAELTSTESRWLRGITPVVAFAREAGLPLDLIVQPQPTPGASPLALAFVDGRCKLVFSMRGNPEAQATLERIDPALLNATLELMAAHELGHCRRYLDGAWFGVPAGFTANVPDIASPDVRAAYVNMQAVRREEGYGDLVGLAWVRERHPQHYARLHAWLMAERIREWQPGTHHDTLVWLHLAARSAPTAPSPHATIFQQALALWVLGLSLEE